MSALKEISADSSNTSAAIFNDLVQTQLQTGFFRNFKTISSQALGKIFICLEQALVLGTGVLILPLTKNDGGDSDISANATNTYLFGINEMMISDIKSKNSHALEAVYDQPYLPNYIVLAASGCSLVYGGTGYFLLTYYYRRPTPPSISTSSGAISLFTSRVSSLRSNDPVPPTSISTSSTSALSTSRVSSLRSNDSAPPTTKANPAHTILKSDAPAAPTKKKTRKTNTSSNTSKQPPLISSDDETSDVGETSDDSKEEICDSGIDSQLLLLVISTNPKYNQYILY